MENWVPFFAIALFAEDMREEPAGTTSLISIVPDTVLLREFPAVLPQLNVYIRIAYNPGNPPRAVSCGLRVNDETPLITRGFDDPQLQQVIAEATTGEASIGTIIARFTASNLALREPCLVNATVTWNDEEFVVGTLMVRLSPTTPAE